LSISSDFGRTVDSTLFSIAKIVLALRSDCQDLVSSTGGTQMGVPIQAAPAAQHHLEVISGMDSPSVAPHTVDQLIETFEPISLEDSAKAALMDRSEAKFVCHINTLLEMLPRLREDYVVLEIDGGRAMGYRSLYLDTPDFGLYMAHHNGKRSRYKVRYRHYLFTDTVFFEVKVREKGKTCKERLKLKSDSDWSHDLPKDFFAAQRPLERRELEPKLEVWCRRITLVGKHSTERLTIDLDLAYALPESCLEPGFANLVILELKYSGKNTTFLPIAHRAHLRGQRFSKYAIGCGLLYPNLKSNAFKPQRLVIERIENHA
jgi:VTC domain